MEMLQSILFGLEVLVGIFVVAIGILGFCLCGLGNEQKLGLVSLAAAFLAFMGTVSLFGNHIAGLAMIGVSGLILVGGFWAMSGDVDTPNNTTDKPTDDVDEAS